MNKITTIGLDLAKNVFHTVCCNERGKVVRKRMLKRSQLLPYFAKEAVCLRVVTAIASINSIVKRISILTPDKTLRNKGYNTDRLCPIRQPHITHHLPLHILSKSFPE